MVAAQEQVFVKSIEEADRIAIELRQKELIEAHDKLIEWDKLAHEAGLTDTGITVFNNSHSGFSHQLKRISPDASSVVVLTSRIIPPSSSSNRSPTYFAVDNCGRSYVCSDFGNASSYMGYALEHLKISKATDGLGAALSSGKPLGSQFASLTSVDVNQAINSVVSNIKTGLQPTGVIVPAPIKS